jgi:hypothetical protein
MILVSATARMGRTPGASSPDFRLDFLNGQGWRGKGRQPVRRCEQAVNPPSAQLCLEQAFKGIGLEQSARLGFACDAVRQPEPDFELDCGLFLLARHAQSLPHGSRYSPLLNSEQMEQRR